MLTEPDLDIMAVSSPSANKQVHLSQLAKYIQTIRATKDTMDQLLLKPGYALFQQIYVACLMHAFYRPLDPSRTVLMLISRSAQPFWESGPNQPVPTHMVGLFHHAARQTSILVWGTCRLVADTALEFCYSYYDSRAILSSPEDTRELQPILDHLIESSVALPYTATSIKFVPSHWSDFHSNHSELEYNTMFCQLISKVVHEFPCNFNAFTRTHPVDPVWAPFLVKEAVQKLLEQVEEGILSLKNVTSVDALVPQCVYLHG